MRKIKQAVSNVYSDTTSGSFSGCKLCTKEKSREARMAYLARVQLVNYVLASLLSFVLLLLLITLSLQTRHMSS